MGTNIFETIHNNANKGSAYNNPTVNPLDALQNASQNTSTIFGGTQGQSGTTIQQGGMGGGGSQIFQPGGPVAGSTSSPAPPQGGIVPPGGAPGGAAIPGVGGATGAPVLTNPDGSTVNSLPAGGQSVDTLAQLANMLQGTSIGNLLNLSLQHGGQNMPTDAQGNFEYPQDILSSLGGIFGGNETMGLGLGEGGGPLAMQANISLGDFLQGAGRGQQREQLLGNIAQDARGSGAFSTGQDLSSAAQRAVDPNALDDRFRALEEEARLQNASSLNSQRNYLQDIGMAGGGMGQAPAILGAERGSSRDLQSTLNQLDAMKTQEQMRNLQAATGAAGTGADIYRALGIEPQLNIASSLGGPQNIQSQQLQNTLSSIGQLASGTALAEQSPSTLQQLAPIFGGGLGALGSIGGGLLGNTNLFK